MESDKQRMQRYRAERNEAWKDLETAKAREKELRDARDAALTKSDDAKAAELALRKAARDAKPAAVDKTSVKLQRKLDKAREQAETALKLSADMARAAEGVHARCDGALSENAALKAELSAARERHAKEAEETSEKMDRLYRELATTPNQPSASRRTSTFSAG